MDEELLGRVDPELTGWRDPVARLRQAVERNEFELYCQPILALSGDHRYPIGEVLVRLREEERSLIPPGEFLPVFEHYRMMPQLDRWVVRRAVRHLAAGSRIGRLSVNLSGQTLEDAEFVRFVAAQLSSNGVPPSALLFEIDESDLLYRPQPASAFAAAYRALGGSVMVDGFGRRLVSFLPLKALGAHFVKVDGAIVRKLLESEVARTKMNAILRVAPALEFAVVAECVEAQDVLLRLKALRVGYAQGFGVFEPGPIDSVARALG